MRTSVSLKLVAYTSMIGALALGACTTSTEEPVDTGTGGAAGSSAGSGGSTAGKAGSGGSTAGSAGSGAGTAGTAGSAGSGAGAGGDSGAGGAAAGAGGAAAGSGGAAAGAGGDAAGAGGAAAGSGGAAAGAGGDAAGAGGAAAGAGGEAGSGGAGGGGQGTGTFLRLANLVVGYKAKALDICVRSSSDADWSGAQPIYKSSGKQTASDQFFSPTVSIWFEAQQVGEVEFRFVAVDAADCNTPVDNKIADFKTTIESGKSYTIILSGDSGTGGSSIPLKLFSLESPTGDAASASLAYFNGIVNVPAGVNMGVYDTGTKEFTAALSSGKTAIKYGEGDVLAVDPVTNNVGIQRVDSKLVLSTTPSTYEFKAGGHYTILATGTNEFAEKSSNNLPWIVVCDDDSNATVDGTNLVAACVYSQGPQFGVK